MASVEKEEGEKGEEGESKGLEERMYLHGKEFWEQRYRSGKAETFDWYTSYSQLRPLVRRIFNGEVPGWCIGMLGCGNSTWNFDMFDDGYQNGVILGIDFSKEVVDQMKNRTPEAQHENIQWRVLDIRDMACLQDEAFDLIIDKGTLDSLYCGPNTDSDVSSTSSEVSRLLKNGGKYLLITHMSAKERLDFITTSLHTSWVSLFLSAVEVSSIWVFQDIEFAGKLDFPHCYVVTKIIPGNTEAIVEQGKLCSELMLESFLIKCPYEQFRLVFDLLVQSCEDETLLGQAKDVISPDCRNLTIEKAKSTGEVYKMSVGGNEWSILIKAMERIGSEDLYVATMWRPCMCLYNIAITDEFEDFADQVEASLGFNFVNYDSSGSDE